MILALVPASSKSQRISRTNLLTLGNKALIGWATDEANHMLQNNNLNHSAPTGALPNNANIQSSVQCTVSPTIPRKTEQLLPKVVLVHMGRNMTQPDLRNWGEA